MAKKYYVVWQGRTPGIYTDWTTCKNQVDKFNGAKYKSFESQAEAEAAYSNKATVAAPAPASAPAPAQAGFGGFSGRAVPSVSGAPKTRAASAAAKSPKTHSAAEVAQVVAEVKIFCDGGCDPNPGKAGSGLALFRDEVLAELWYGLYNPRGTNNTAELNALHQALIMAKDGIDAGQSVAVFCDSKYAIQCVTQWAVSWKKKGWTKEGGEIKNLELIKEIFALHQSIKDTVQVLHVNGHVGVVGNELADRMSNLARGSRAIGFLRYEKALDVPAILAMRAG